MPAFNSHGCRLDICLFLAAAMAMPDTSPSAAAESIPLTTAIQPAGTVSFKLHTERAWRNGAGEENETVTFLRIPNLGEFRLQKDSSAVGFGWRWLGAAGAPNFLPLVPELPGPETYYVQFTWDARLGNCDFYVNGTPMRDPKLPFEPWQFENQPAAIEIADGSFRLSNVETSAHYLAPVAARREVPPELLDRRAEVFGCEKKPEPMALDGRLGRLLYEAAEARKGTGPICRNGPEGASHKLDLSPFPPWVMEGPGEVSFADGWMRMRSTRPDAGRDENGHIVYWCPRDFPARFVAEWDAQMLRDAGLVIVFFAAKGEHGEDIFHPSLPKRDGTFTDYTRGAINSYHVSYYASTPGFPGRATANLRKNNQFYLVANGEVAIPAGDGRVHHVRLVKDGPHIQFQTDGRVVIDYIDPGDERYGPVHGGGKIGFRQMQWTVAQYRNFRVTELHAASE